jgi:hypothetical protein
MSALSKDHPHGYVDSAGDKHDVLFWGSSLIVTRRASTFPAEFSWSRSGVSAERMVSLTLRNAPAPKRSGTVWVNIYSHDGWSYPSRAEADASRQTGCIACIEVPWTEGDGLTTPAISIGDAS